MRTLCNIHDGVFLRKQLTASGPLPFSQKSSIEDIWHSSKYTSEPQIYYLPTDDNKDPSNKY